MRFQEFYNFWFGEGDLGDAAYVNQRLKIWFAKDEKFDAQVRTGFASLLEGYPRPETEGWPQTIRGHLALVLLLDQVPRNSFRGEARQFAYDSAALKLTREALRLGYDNSLSLIEIVFLLLPLEHSEDLVDQDECVRRFQDLVARAPDGLEKVIADTAEYARKHREIIARFGRFPHRNKVLGRTSTPEELEFLKQPGSSF